ncbi:hypothetical protein FLJC2902T_25860 [Flavobacterium limnosediminis JC2902]|uniref:Uncharacterized protein n=1 Tax=Flavobacterium limnosediminis JC2902 TaxID=1341181 RepID=V6SJZ4_9FLAO|nr:hypothetical protein [Flavobacterium limnosediminis]ESU26612.1 hypothetical protein FLJC2902T_25860 [Flavobacterium limnosediminis JC2902]
MKKTLTLFCLFLLTAVSAQQITMEKGKFFKNGEQISSWETKQLMITNPEAYKHFKSAKTKEGFGGFLLGLGIGLTIGDIVKGAVSDTDYPSGFTYVGASCIVASIPVLSGRKKKLETALEIYNKGLQPTANTIDFDLNILANANGYGLQITF